MQPLDKEKALREDLLRDRRPGAAVDEDRSRASTEDDARELYARDPRQANLWNMIDGAGGRRGSPTPTGGERAAGTDGASRLYRARATPGAPDASAAPLGANAHASSEHLASAGIPGDPLVRRKVEQTTGAELSGVRVHTGQESQQAALGMSAKAFTVGNDIHFAPGAYQPGTAEGDRLLAHEMVHTVQQRSGPVAAQLDARDTSQPGDAAEHEADRIASAALSGSAARTPLVPVERAAPIARATIAGNPRDPQDNAGNNITQHQPPSLNDAINHQAPAPTSATPHAANVMIIAGEANKLHLQPPRRPAASQVYVEEAAPTSPAPAGFTMITSQEGSVAAPMLEEQAANDIFINGTPRADDVQQMGIGDCYFVSTVMSIVARDPGKISSMMVPDGSGGATVTMWKRTPHDKTFLEGMFGGPEHDYTQVSISVSADLAFRIDNGRIHGAQLRAAEAPKHSDYWAKLEGDKLEVRRNDVYEVARWAPLLEKAFARMAETAGQYGGRTGDAPTPAGQSGYADIDGGVPFWAYFLFYGPAADNDDTKRENIKWDPGTNVLTDNKDVVDQLLLLQGRGDEVQPGDRRDVPIVTAQAFVEPLIDNLAAAIPAAQADPDYAKLSVARQGHITDVMNAINAWNALPGDPAPPAPQPKAQALPTIGNRCADAVRPGAPNPADLQAIQAANPGRVLFAQGSEQVGQADQAPLTALGTALASKQQPEVNVDIVGRASSAGTEEANLTLSASRARHVKEAIEAAGNVAHHNLTSSGQGEAGAGPTPDWRRVDISIEPVESTNPLHDGARSAPIRAMMDLMLDLRNIGTDASGGQRNIYGGHSYSVVGVSFVTTTGQTVPLSSLPTSLRPALYGLVDANVSTVRLRNPHHGNEPDRQGDGRATRPGDGAPAGASSDGIFTMSLEEFFRNFSAVDSGVYPRSS